jgi:hypothetical protein
VRTLAILSLLAVTLSACGAAAPARPSETAAARPGPATSASAASEPVATASHPHHDGRPDIVPGPAAALRFVPAAGLRLRVTGSVAFQLASGSASFVDCVHRWTITQTLEEQLLSARYHSASGLDAPLAYVTAPDGQVLRWTFDTRAQLGAEPEVVSAGDPARDLVTLMLPELVHTRVALDLPADDVAPGDTWTSEHEISIPTHFGRWNARYAIDHQLLRVEAGEAWVWLEGRVALPRRDTAGIVLEGSGDVWGIVHVRVADGVPTMLDLREAVQVTGADATMGWERRIMLEITNE